MKASQLFSSYFIKNRGLNGGQEYPVELVDARELITPERLDLMIKLEYLRFYDRGVPNAFAEDMYRAHIRAFSDGLYIEPGDAEKNSADQYLLKFHGLIASIREKGVRPELSAIPVGRGNVIMAGAHRVAIAAYFGQKVPVVRLPEIFLEEYDKTDYRFFIYRCLDEKYLDYAVMRYCAWKQRDIYTLCFWPRAEYAAHEERVMREAALAGCKIVYEKRLRLPLAAIQNLVLTVYGGADWLGTAENGFQGALKKAELCYREHADLILLVAECNSHDAVAELKGRLRGIFQVGNHSVHTNDSYAEAMELVQALLNENSVRFLCDGRPFADVGLLENLRVYREAMTAQGRDPEDFAVDSSAVLGIYGLRRPRDIDYLPMHEGLGLERREINDHRECLALYGKPLEALLYHPENHFYFRGLKFISPACVRAMKSARGEEKDRRDVALLNRVIHEKPVKRVKFAGFWPSFYYPDYWLYRILRGRYELVFSDEPDYLIFSCYQGWSYLRDSDCVRIGAYGEVMPPSLLTADYAISFDPGAAGGRNFYNPSLLLRERSFYREFGKKDFGPSVLTEKTSFCNFIYAHLGTFERERLYRAVSAYKPVDSPGCFLNNMDGSEIGGRFARDFRTPKIAFQRRYKFTIICENCHAPRYFAEKILDAFAAHTIPICIGAPGMESVYNPGAYLDARAFPSLEALVDRVRELDNDDAQYLAMLNQPAFCEGFDIDAYFDRFDQFLASVFDVPVERAMRRIRFDHPFFFERDILRGEILRGHGPRRRRYGVWGSYNARAVCRQLCDSTGDTLAFHYGFANVGSAMHPTAMEPEGVLWPENAFRAECLRADFDKRFQREAAEGLRADYLLLDLLEERFGLVSCAGGLLTDSDALRDGTVPGLGALFFPGEDRWKEACLAFVRVLQGCFSPERVILLEYYLSVDIRLRDSASRFAGEEEIVGVNQRLRRCYAYFKDVFPGVKCITLPERLNYTSAEHPFGCVPCHLNPLAYQDLFVKAGTYCNALEERCAEAPML